MLNEMVMQISALGPKWTLSLAATVAAVALFLTNVGNIRSSLIDLLFPQPPKLTFTGVRLSRPHRAPNQEYFIAMFEGTIVKDGRNKSKKCSVEVRLPKRSLTFRMMRNSEIETFDIGYGSQSKAVSGIVRFEQVSVQIFMSDFKDGKVGKPQARVRANKAASDWVEVEYIQ